MNHGILPAIFSLLTPEVTGRIAAVLGRDRAAIDRAVRAAVPGILSGLAHLSSTPEGAHRLESTITWQVARISEPGTDLTRGLESGKGALSALFGYAGFNELAAAISRFSGIGIGSSRSVLGMIAPAVLGTLGRAQQEAGVGAAGLAQMLSAQIGDISAAMPRGFSELLETGGFFDAVDTAPPAAARPAEARDRTLEDYTPLHAVGEVAGTSRRSQYSWLYWAVPLTALAVLAWYLLPLPDRAARYDEVAPSTVTRPPDTREASDIARQIASATELLRASLQDISDPASATRVLPKLQEAAGELERATLALERLAPQPRRTAATLASPAAAKLKNVLDGTAAKPDVAAVLQPTLQAVRERLDVLAEAAPSPLLAQQPFLSTVPAGSVAVSSFYLRDVHNGMGEKVGTIKDLVLEPSGRVAAVVVGVGELLGIGEKEIAVPFSAMTKVRRGDSWYVVVDVPRDALQAAPAFTGEFERVRLTPAQ